MILKEFTKLFPDNTIISIVALSKERQGVIYHGRISSYRKSLDFTYPDTDFDSFEITECQVCDNSIKILLED